MSDRGFNRYFLPLANVVARQDLAQTDREALAEALAEAIDKIPGRSSQGDWKKHWDKEKRHFFVTLASDPLVPCAGYERHDTGGHVDCPHGRVIRIAMHLSTAADGRSKAWRERAPYGEIRCVTCGAMQFIPEYQENVLREGSA